MVEVLAALSAAAAAGIRIALPLLVVGLQGNDWYYVPLLSSIPPSVVTGVLASWLLIELFASKHLLGQRLLQVFQLIFSPIVGAIMAVGVAKQTEVPNWLIGLVGALLAFVLQLAQAGWFYRWRSLPLWVVFVQDALGILLVFFAFKAPELGGLIALLLLWWAVRSSSELYRWYLEQRSS